MLSAIRQLTETDRKEFLEEVREMNKNSYIVATVVVLALIVVGAIFFNRKQTVEPEVPTIQDTGVAIPTEGSVETMMRKESAVSYSDSGFTPATLTVKAGTVVTFTNSSSKKMWVASAVHPIHQELPGFDELKSVGRGESYVYTFDKVGAWKYHNHVAPADRGVVVVE